MRVTTPLENIARGGAKAPAALPRAVEKTSAASDLGAQPRFHERRDDKAPRRLQVELVCQDNTDRFDPFWDGPRLIPIFVAQLLGQVMPERRAANALAHTAYGSAAPPLFGAPVPKPALWVDRKS